MRPRRAVALILAAGAALVLSACSGVPTNSKPEVIGPVAGGVAPSSAAVASPAPGADPRSIVLGFLDGNVSKDAHHTSARTYLTADASKKWVDTTTTVVGAIFTGVLNFANNTVIVTANKVGAVDARGVYTPVTEGSGSSQISLTFGLTQVSGQWRINTLANGLLVDQSDFLQTYKQRPVYFFDQNQRRLVPDLRYTPLTDQTLVSWLLDQLIAGPRAELQSAYTSDLPDQNAHAAVTYGATIAVNLPGASQLDGPTRSRLAAQLGYTFSLDFSSLAVTLSDGPKLVSIPSITQPFLGSSFPTYQPVTVSPTVYFVRNGAVFADNGAKASGPGTTGLTSIAVAQRGSSMLVAATTGKVDAESLVVGPVAGTLAATNVGPGPLTRPAWPPALSEVWVGDGPTLLRVPWPGGTPAAVALASSSGTVSGQIRSVAFSPDGVRVALIIKAVDGSSQLWIGTIVRTTDGASVQSLEPITPIGLVLTDVAWNDTSTLYAVGADPTVAGGYGIWSVEVDGSLLAPRSISGLPSQPDSITASPLGLPWVSANTTVWKQGGPENSWTSPNGGPGTAAGSSPNYLQ